MSQMSDIDLSQFKNSTSKNFNIISSSTFSECGKLNKIIIPKSVTTIGDYAFSSCTNLESIVIPSSVTSIGSYAFSGTNLKNITIPESVTEIGYDAFLACKKLTSGSFENYSPVLFD